MPSWPLSSQVVSALSLPRVFPSRVSSPNTSPDSENTWEMRTQDSSHKLPCVSSHSFLFSCSLWLNVFFPLKMLGRY